MTRDIISLISYVGLGCLGLSPEISVQIHYLSVRPAWNRQKFTKTPISWVKVVQGHRCWYHRKGRQQCLLWYAASLCLSATVLTL